MLRRLATSLLILALLSALGMPLRRPCCGLQELMDVAADAPSDCCPMPDCCRGEKRSPEQAVTTKAPDTGPHPMTAVAMSPPAFQLAGLLIARPVACSPTASPPAPSPSQPLLSVFRI